MLAIEFGVPRISWSNGSGTTTNEYAMLCNCADPTGPVH